ncbi:MAG: hypothetical protein HND47_18135 [Chloroflexi bacterium]|nr:hypothetical protein [Chloroflexota bacterium]
MNNYILEHFYRWLIRLDASYWSAPFFYPFPYTIAFSESLLGSAPIYALFRFAGLDGVSSFQGWFLVGYSLNFFSAAGVLSKAKFHPLAVGVGGFLFAFGLPVLAQENHAQLLYRCFVPLACYSLWELYQLADLKKTLLFCLAMVGQFFLSVYIGVFLFTLTVVMALLMIVMDSRSRSIRSIYSNFADNLLGDWARSSVRRRFLFASWALTLLIAFGALMYPYFHVSRVYGFVRTWEEISALLPRPESFLLADNSGLWGNFSLSLSDIPNRHEHQLFPGLAAAVLLITGISFLRPFPKMPALYLWAVMISLVLTINIQGYSFYKLFFGVPGLNSIRGITRLELVLIWPVAFFITWVLDVLLKFPGRYKNVICFGAYSLILLMALESVLYNHTVYDRFDAEARLEELQQDIPMPNSKSPILFSARSPDEPAWMTEMDAMLVSQRLGWATFNGYSGNAPPNYEPAKACRKLPRRIQTYIDFSGIEEDRYYFDLMNRTVLVGFEDCDPRWWTNPP